jgi:hypothetical protein
VSGVYVGRLVGGGYGVTVERGVFVERTVVGDNSVMVGNGVDLQATTKTARKMMIRTFEIYLCGVTFMNHPCRKGTANHCRSGTHNPFWANRITNIPAAVRIKAKKRSPPKIPADCYSL